MKYLKGFVFFLMVLFTVSASYAAPDLSILNTSLESFYSFDDADLSGSTVTDLVGNHDGVLEGADTGFACVQNECFDYIQANEDRVDISNWAWGTAGFSISAWVNIDDVSGYKSIINKRDSGVLETFQFLILDDKILLQIFDTDGDLFVRETGAELSASTWHHIVGTYNGGTLHTDVELWVDGVQADITGSNTGTFNTPEDNSRACIGAHANACNTGTTLEMDGKIEAMGIWLGKVLSDAEIGYLYNNSYGIQYPWNNASAGSPTPEATERLEQSSTIDQTGSAVITNSAYNTFLSANIEITPATTIYMTASIPIINPSASNTAQCRIRLDGIDQDSAQTRTNTIGNDGHMSLLTNLSVVSASNYTVELQCKRLGSGTYSIDDASLSVHQMITSGGVDIEHNYSDNSQAFSTGTPVVQFNLTTSANDTAAGLTRYIIVDWVSEMTYSSTGNVSFIPVIAGTNCTRIKRYGTSGTGSAGGSCVITATNDTTYNLKLYASAPGVSGSTISQMVAKEVISHTAETTNISASGSVTSSIISHIVNVTITPNGGHSAGNVFARVGISAQSDTNDSVDMTFKFVSDSNSTTINRTVSAAQPGVTVLEYTIQNVTSAVTVGLWASCGVNNCTILSGDFIAYFTDAQALTPNEFIINATDFYNSSLIQSFNSVVDTVGFSTTNGIVTISSSDALVNITTPGIQSTIAGVRKYFVNSTINHDTTTNHSVVLTPWTSIYAKTGAGLPVTNFSIEYQQVNGSSNDSVTTTNGVVYVPISSGNWTVTINSSGTAIQSINLSGSPYLQNYTFILLTQNTFNLSIYDEITGQLITGENFTVELISDVFAFNYSTAAGILEVTLLTPSDYTIRYRSATYTERDYIVTLAPQSYNTIDLYAITINASSQLLVYTQDTTGDALEGATVSLLRYFVDTNSYKIVEMAETSYSGEAGFWVQATEGFYKWSVNYQGSNRFLSTSPENIFTDTRIFTIDLGSNYYQSYNALPKLASNIKVNYATNSLTFSWSDPSGLANQGCINAEKLAGVKWVDAGQTCALGSSGSVVLVPGNFSANRFKYWSTISTSTNFSDHILGNGFTEFAGQLWNSLAAEGTPATSLGMFLGVTLVGGLALLFSFSAVAVLIVTVVGLIFVNILGLMPFSLQFITGIGALAVGFGLYLMRR